MILSDDIRIEVAKALGHLCVPFSTEEEANKGADILILLFLKMIKAYIKVNNITDVRPVQFFGDIWVGLASFDNYEAFIRIQSRFLNSYDLISDYESSDVSKESKQIIKTELKSRGLL
jgi:hypothetical protein